MGPDNGMPERVKGHSAPRATKGPHRSRGLFLLLPVSFIAIAVVLSFVLKPRPSSLFRRFILDPMPQSVTGIRASQPVTVFGIWYLGSELTSPSSVKS